MSPPQTSTCPNSPSGLLTPYDHRRTACYLLVADPPHRITSEDHGARGSTGPSQLCCSATLTRALGTPYALSAGPRARVCPYTHALSGPSLPSVRAPALHPRTAELITLGRWREAVRKAGRHGRCELTKPGQWQVRDPVPKSACFN